MVELTGLGSHFSTTTETSHSNSASKENLRAARWGAKEEGQEGNGGHHRRLSAELYFPFSSFTRRRPHTGPLYRWHTDWTESRSFLLQKGNTMHVNCCGFWRQCPPHPGMLMWPVWWVTQKADCFEWCQIKNGIFRRSVCSPNSPPI